MKDQSPRVKRFVAKYIRYLAIFSWLLVAFVGGGLGVAWFVKVNDTVGSAGQAEIKPHEQPVTRAVDAVVLKVLVPDHADVTVGQALVEICEDPACVERHRAGMQSSEELREEVGSRTTKVVLYAPAAGRRARRL